VSSIRKLTGVYNARGTVAGELAYLLGKVSGRTHCGLCDINHGPRLRERQDWREERARLPVLEAVHLNERSVEVGHACPRAPCVVAHTDDGLVPLLAPADIDACAGSAKRSSRRSPAPPASAASHSRRQQRLTSPRENEFRRRNEIGRPRRRLRRKRPSPLQPFHPHGSHSGGSRPDDVPTVRGDQRDPIKRKAEPLGRAPIRRRVRLVRPHLVDRDHQLDCIGQTAPLQQSPRMLLAPVRQRRDPNSRLLEAPDRFCSVGIRFQLAQTLQHLVGATDLAAQLLEHRGQRRSCELTERPELATIVSIAAACSIRPNHASRAPSGAPALLSRARNGARSNIVPITSKTTASVTVHFLSIRGFPPTLFL
jgi:hypothetical protein